MAQRIENLVADVKLLSSAVSHDLRTPLARIRFGIDTLKEEDNPILRRSFEEKISNNVDEMTSLVETLLSYSRLEQTMLDIKKKPVNLSQLIRQCVNSHKTEGVNIHFHQSIDNINILADENYINMLVNNLLTNAINYGEGEVLISLKLKHELKKDCIELIIADNGDGIQTEHCEKIFLPFVRDNHSLKKVKGHGVGLAIVKRVIEWHHGSICINRSIELSGAEFVVQLPVQGNYKLEKHLTPF
jgi:two-component system OmpR family sensor kinase